MILQALTDYYRVLEQAGKIDAGEGVLCAAALGKRHAGAGD